MTAQAVYLPERVKIGLTGKLLDASVVQSGDTGLDWRIKRSPLMPRTWNVTWVVDSVPDVERMFEVFGTTTSFLMRPKRIADFRETSQACTNTVTGTNLGDGSTATFQLKITRTQGSISGSKNIMHPRTGTVKVYVNAVEKTITTHWTVSLTTGIVTFTAGNEPANGLAVTADFDYDTPVRFLSDDIQTTIQYVSGAEMQQEAQASVVEVFDE